MALEEKVTVCFGGDAGVFSHGDNVRELEAMVAGGMSPLDALRSATSGNAAGTFTLSKANLLDTPGANGGQLSGVLDLSIKDVTKQPQTAKADEN